jgi:rhodanese-related sulfurtransferase
MKAVLRAVVIGCAAFVLGLAVNRRPGGIGWPVLRESLPWGKAQVERINAESAFSVMNSVRFLDVRSIKEFTIDRIPGAQWLDFTELAGGRFDPVIPKSTRLILYCFDPVCPRIELACRILIRKGYQAFILENGFGGWIESGLPIERGA